MEEQAIELDPEFMSKIGEQIIELNNIYISIYPNYKAAADSLIRKGKRQSVSDDELSQLLEDILNYCMDDQFVELYRKVCRTFYHSHTELISEYVLIYRRLYVDGLAEDV